MLVKIFKKNMDRQNIDRGSVEKNGDQMYVGVDQKNADDIFGTRQEKRKSCV